MKILFIIIIILTLFNCKTQNQRLNRYRLNSEDESWVWGGSNSQFYKQKYLTKRPRYQENPTRLVPNTRITTKGCGEAPLIHFTRKIVGGREAELGEYPWQVALLRNYKGDLNQICGAALLNEWWIITAAHCLVKPNGINLKPQDLKIAVGTHDISKIKASDVRTVNRIIRHEKYHLGNRGEQINDIALLHVSSQIDLESSNLVKSVCLPKQGESFFRDLEVSGWGLTEEEGFESKVLRTVDVYVKSNNDCRTRLEGQFRSREMFCAGVNEGGKDACQGDSGGPIVKRRNKIATLAGIVSYGIGCGQKGRPGVYTRVSNYVNWIQKHIN